MSDKILLSAERALLRLVAILLLSILVFMVPSQKAYGATKYYEANLNGKKSHLYTGSIYRIRFKGSKLIVRGSFAVYPTKKDFRNRYGNGKKSFIRYKKRTFNLAKNIRFYGSEESGRYRESRKEFVSTVAKLNGLDLVLTIKNGKVIEATLYS